MIAVTRLTFWKRFAAVVYCTGGQTAEDLRQALHRLAMAARSTLDRPSVDRRS